MKKMMIAFAAALCVGVCMARPGPGGFRCGPRGFHGGFRGGPGFHHGPRFGHHHGGFWGPGGRHFWPGFIGGVVGGVLYDTVRYPYYRDTVVVQPTTTVVTQPVVTQPVVVQQHVVVQPATTVQNVWVEGRYIDQVQANGSVVRVWQPGHYEQRSVLVQ